MPLNDSDLAKDLEGIASNPPPSSAECARAWANAVGAYASPVVPPSASVAAAKETLAGALAGAFTSPLAAPLMEVAFAAFATTVGLGMAPAFVAVPPAAPVGFASQFAGPKPPTHAAAGVALAALVSAWMRSGKATPALGGPQVPWT